jgi:hypothetical protein
MKAAGERFGKEGGNETQYNKEQKFGPLERVAMLFHEDDAVSPQQVSF